jgi:protein CpxP
MIRLNTKHFALSVLLASTTLAAAVPALAQPMMGEMGINHDESHMHERMLKHWEKRRAELKTKLQLTGEQELAWTTFVQSIKMPAAQLSHPIDREALAKMNTPERMDKMNAVHEANLAAMQAYIKQRTEATRTFYSQLSLEQQRIFDVETLPEHSRWKGKAN